MDKGEIKSKLKLVWKKVLDDEFYTEFLENYKIKRKSMPLIKARDDAWDEAWYGAWYEAWSEARHEARDEAWDEAWSKCARLAEEFDTEKNHG